MKKYKVTCSLQHADGKPWVNTAPLSKLSGAINGHFNRPGHKGEDRDVCLRIEDLTAHRPILYSALFPRSDQARRTGQIEMAKAPNSLEPRDPTMNVFEQNVRGMIIGGMSQSQVAKKLGVKVHRVAYIASKMNKEKKATRKVRRIVGARVADPVVTGDGHSHETAMVVHPAAVDDTHTNIEQFDTTAVETLIAGRSPREQQYFRDAVRIKNEEGLSVNQLSKRVKLTKSQLYTFFGTARQLGMNKPSASPAPAAPVVPETPKQKALREQREAEAAERERLIMEEVERRVNTKANDPAFQRAVLNLMFHDIAQLPVEEISYDKFRGIIPLLHRYNGDTAQDDWLHAVLQFKAEYEGAPGPLEQAFMEQQGLKVRVKGRKGAE